MLGLIKVGGLEEMIVRNGTLEAENEEAKVSPELSQHSQCVWTSGLSMSSFDGGGSGDPRSAGMEKFLAQLNSIATHKGQSDRL